MPAKTKKRNPKDLTSRNNDARKKEIEALKKRVDNVEKELKILISMMKFLTILDR
jgi:hypothetical protein